MRHIYAHMEGLNK